MMRDTRTLKGLFAEPMPPGRKNFIKENVKSLRQMEKLFHVNDTNIKDLNLRVPKATRVPNKNNGMKHSAEKNTSQEYKRKDDSENEMVQLISKKLLLENHDNKKRSAPIISRKKTVVKKLTKPSVNGNVLKKNHGYKNQANHNKTENRQMLKSHSIGDIMNLNLNEDINDVENIKCKTQGVQTLDTSDIDSLYSEGVIRYPSGRKKDMENFKPDRGDIVSEQNDSIQNHSDDYIQDINSAKTNKESITLASKLASQLKNTAPPPSYRVGVVPKYIKERKEALQKEQLAKIAAKQSDCPKGHVPLPDHERKETLSILRKNYQEYVQELNALPIRTDTLRSQKRKMEIEKQLAKLEEAIKVFSRTKVFVKVDS